MQVEPTITAGNIITLAVTLVTVLVGAGRILFKLSKMELKLNLMWQWFRKEHDIQNGDE